MWNYPAEGIDEGKLVLWLSQKHGKLKMGVLLFTLKWRLQVARSWSNLPSWQISPSGVKDDVLRQLSAMTQMSMGDWKDLNCLCLSQNFKIWMQEWGWPWRSNMIVSISYTFLFSLCTSYLSLTSVGNCLPRNTSMGRTSQTVREFLNHSTFIVKHAK